MIPTIVLHQGGGFLATALPVRGRIVTTVLRVFLNAVAHARLSLARKKRAPILCLCPEQIPNRM